MMRLLASWELGLGYGHVANLAPVAAALRQAGHEVVLAARDPAVAFSHGGGAFARIYRAPRYFGRPPDGETLTYGQVIAAGGFADSAGLIARIREWLALFAKEQPDALLAEHAPASLLAAHIAGIPAVRIGPGFTAPRANAVTASLQPWRPILQSELRESGSCADLVVRAVCRAFGAAPLDGLADLLERAPGFTLSWPEIDHHGGAQAYYGPLGGIAGEHAPAWPMAEGPRLLVYLPFDRPAAIPVIEALHGLGWPAIWHSAMPAAIDLPANIAYSPAPLDLQELGRTANLFIGRGGHGAGCAMLQAGVAQLLFPDTLESLLVTYRLRAAGVAAYQTVSADAATVRGSIERAAGSESLRNCAARRAACHAGYEPREAAEKLAADLISALR